MKFMSGLKHRNNRYFANFVVNKGNIKYNQSILFKEEISEEGGTLMNNAELVWRLVELLLQKEKDLNQLALDQAKNNKPNDQKQNEAQLAENFR